jgi:hypothetical protein
MRPVIFAALLSACVALAPRVAIAEASRPVVVQVQHAQASIAQFNRTHSDEDLNAALRSLQAAGAQRLQGNDRATVLGGYLSLFGAIDRALPHLPPGKVPQVSVEPPPVNGVRYPAGVDPSVIPDPAVRARYEQEIKDNEALSKSFLEATSLSHLDDRALTLFADFTHDAFGRSTADQAALRRQIESSDLTTARKNRLLKTNG